MSESKRLGDDEHRAHGDDDALADDARGRWPLRQRQERVRDAVSARGEDMGAHVLQDNRAVPLGVHD